MTKKKYKQLNQFERDRIELLLTAGHKQIEIARVLGRSPGTISREIERNKLEKDGKSKNKGEYKASTAGHKARFKKKYAKYRGKKINENDKLCAYIVEKLKQGCNPDEISGRMKRDGEKFYVSKTAIYEWLYSIYGQKHCKYLKSKQYSSRRGKKKKTKKSLIQFRIGIEERPDYINDLSEFGHWEGDTIVSGKKTRSKFALVVLYERKTKLVRIRKINSLKPIVFNSAVLNIARENQINSLTLDNGIENQYHYRLGIDTYFCDPYSSWQKGGVENVNKMIRYFIPKGCDISLYSENYIKMIEDLLNNKPRKILYYKTALEQFNSEICVIKNTSQKIALEG